MELKTPDVIPCDVVPVPAPRPVRSGTVTFREYETWYEVVGDLASGFTPLVVLHGGPGATHEYLGRVASLVGDGRPVVFYDQIGNGQSTHLRDAPAETLTVEFFLAELDNLLAHLGLSGGYMLLGHSWGGMLAAEHAVRHPAGLRALVLADAPASMPLFERTAERLRAALPEEIERVLRTHEAAGTTDTAEYQQAAAAYVERHICRVVPLPEDAASAPRSIEADPTVFATMIGPSDFHVVGSLKDWSIVDRCSAIDVPTLLLSGEYDEAAPETVQPYYDLIRDVRWTVFPKSSHLPFVEEPEAFGRTVSEFLDSFEQAA